jgi:hypothetical protein
VATNIDPLETLINICDTMTAIYNDAPGLPLTDLPTGDLEKWTSALIALGKNLGAARQVTRGLES